MMDAKKLSAILKGPAEPDTGDSEVSIEEDLASDVLDALKARDSASLASALKAFIDHCSYGAEDEDSDDEE